MASMPDDAKVLGMEVGRLQSNVAVDSGNVLHGTSHYMTDFEAYDKGAAGNFVAVHVTAPSDAEVKITTSAVSDKPMDGDRTTVWKINSPEDTLKVTVVKGEETAETVYSAGGLTLEPAE